MEGGRRGGEVRKGKEGVGGGPGGGGGSLVQDRDKVMTP